MGNLCVVAAISDMLVEHLEEDLKDRITAVILLGLAVDVEEDDLGMGIRQTPQITLKNTVADDLLDEEI